ncbi:Tyrosinase [Fulvia fulva]|uniref:tyrosinase n=1 Tax=Passalora fulva TaxID=5499 RepID=A0A1P8YXV3_PASFU|nr:Tyrosinase [Fulvia fulva]AQA29351.1 hypothetical protein 58 [Fulvia fulva]KAK4631916.1 Tyrosinase [Fulvia fulva]KAK4632612.1 Tyrosinase [Fulvia fulva]UJO14613.1 Tyrosinase [Fulvia fulva]WPV11696.1 Tyrosinase [Fulvia fulva]
MLFTSAALSSLSLIATLSQTVAAHGSSHNAHQRHHLRQAAEGDPVIVTGSRSFGDGEVHSRLEVSDMFTNRPDQWTLLILAMEKFQSGGESNLTSYYAVSGIHGVPREEWDGVRQCDTCHGADGYCTHDSVLFPAWHRVYMVFFERLFLEIAQEIADSYPPGPLRRRMQKAVESLRWPYWDWAAKPEGDHCLPEFLSAQQINITGQNGDETIDNPLYSYKFVDPSKLYYAPFNQWHSTLRYPNSNNADVSGDEQSVVNAFDSVRQTLQDQVYSLLANCDNYLYFSNDAPGGTYAKCANSLEQIHNSVHTTGGGPGSKDVSGGHLTYLPLAAFDPIFWFHHCQVDRIFALWQTIYPNSYGADQVAPHHTWTIPEGSTQGIDSDLTPFRDSPNSFWTTRKVRDWQNTFGYTYPEFASTDGSRQAIINAVNGLYGPNADKTAPSISRTVEKGSLNKRALQPSGPPPPSHGSSTTEQDSLTPLEDSPAPQGDSPEQPSGSYNVSTAHSVSYSTSYSTATSTGYGSVSTGHPAVYPNMTVGGNNPFKTSNGSTYEYMCHFQSPRYTLNGSYVIYAFDGTPESDDTTTWNGDKSCIGSIGIMAGGDMAKPDVISYGGVPMTRHLQERCKEGKLEGMQEKHVTPYLAKNLEWKIVRSGEVIDPDVVPNFQAAVYSGTSSPAGPNSLGSWHSYTPQVEVTKNKAGGAQSAPVADCPVPSPFSPASPVAAPYPAPNGTAPGGYGYPPAGTGAPSGTGVSPNQPPAYTGAAGKPSFQIAGLLAAAGLVAVL